MKRTVLGFISVAFTVAVASVSASWLSRPIDLADPISTQVVGNASTDRMPQLGSSESPRIIHVDGEGLPPTLEDMLGAELVVVGTVGQVLRMAHSPYIHNGPAQHTVFAFHIRERLKDDPRLKGNVVKVKQHMGDLPWQDGDVFGQGLRISGQALLEPGQDYILFLNRPPLGGLAHHVAEYNGVRGKTGDGDEYVISFGGFGQIFLENGETRVPAVRHGRPIIPWKFEKGRQILGLGVHEARELIKSTNRTRTQKEKEREARAREETAKQLKIPQRPQPPQEHGPVGSRRPPL